MLLSFLVYRTCTRKKFIFLFFLLFILLNVQVNALLLARATLDFHILPQISSYEHGDYLLLSSVYCLLIFAVVYFSLAPYYKRIVDDNIIMEHTRVFFCLPLLFFIILYVLGKTILTIFFKMPKELFLPLILLNIFALFSYYAALKSIIANYDASREHEKLYAAENQLALWKTQYNNLQSKIDSDARIRHDWRQHIITIMGYVENKDLPGLENYLVDYKDKYLLPDSEAVCDIPSLNMLFQYYQHEAKEKGILFTIHNVLLKECGISDPELTVLFGNLLENAIEACEKVTDDSKYICFKAIRKDNKIILLCENSFDGLLNKNKNKITSRKDTGGIGVSSIEGIVEKYHGQMKIETADRVFKIYAYLIDRI